MRKYGGYICFLRLEAQTLAKKRSTFSLFYYVIWPQTLFTNNCIYSRYLLVMIKHAL